MFQDWAGRNQWSRRRHYISKKSSRSARGSTAAGEEEMPQDTQVFKFGNILFPQKK